MKLQHTIQLTAALLFACTAIGQGTFIYDQQSATETGAFQDGGSTVPGSEPFGQSFTPTFSAVNFIRLWINDVYPSNGTGATVVLNLRSNSITGPILASTTPVMLPDGFGDSTNGFVDFFFPTSVGVVSNTMYFFEPIALSGSDTTVVAGSFGYNYQGGNMYAFGNLTGEDLWFREGIYVVPEPSTAALFLVGTGAWLVGRRKRQV